MRVEPPASKNAMFQSRDDFFRFNCNRNHGVLLLESPPLCFYRGMISYRSCSIEKRPPRRRHDRFAIHLKRYKILPLLKHRIFLCKRLGMVFKNRLAISTPHLKCIHRKPRWTCKPAWYILKCCLGRRLVYLPHVRHHRVEAPVAVVVVVVVVSSSSSSAVILTVTGGDLLHGFICELKLSGLQL